MGTRKHLDSNPLMGSYNVGDPKANGRGIPRLLTERLSAERYSKWLKNDPVYKQEVRDHRDKHRFWRSLYR